MLRNQCPSCRSQDIKIIYKEPYIHILPILNETYHQDWSELENYDYELLECQACTLIFQRYILDDIKKIYSHSPTKIQFQKDSSLSVNLPEILIMLNFLRGQQAQILDFGCGNGSFIKIVRALDINSFYSEVVRDIELEKLCIQYIDIFNCSLKFDYIYTNQVFEHLNEPYIILKNLTSLLKIGGIIKIEVPNGVGIKRRIKQGINWENIYKDKKRFNQVAPLEHINCFNYKSLFLLAKSCGLKLLSPPLEKIRFKRRIVNYFPIQTTNFSHYIPLNLYLIKK